MIFLKRMILFAKNKMYKLFPVRFRYRHYFVSIKLQPSGYFMSPRLALGAT